MISCSEDDSAGTPTYSFDAEVGTSSTGHFLVGGAETAGQSMLVTSLGWEDLHAAMESLGAEAGNNVNPETDPNWKSALSGGSVMDITITWVENGVRQTATLEEFLRVTTTDGSSAGEIELRYTGNTAQQASTHPGHRLCLVTCPFGVVSNGSLPVTADANHSFTGARAVSGTVNVSMGLRGGVRGGVRAMPKLFVRPGQ